MTDLVFDSGFSNNSIYILDALSSTELQTGRRLSEELGDLAYDVDSPYCSYIRTSSSADFLAALSKIENLCASGIKPVIHIECHGDVNSGVIIGDQKEKITWEDLSERLRHINKASRNNLGVVMAGCFGLYAIRPITINRPSPFYFLIGSQVEVSAGEIDETMKKFYRALFADGSLKSAMSQLSEKFQQYHVEKMFCISYGRYIKQHCIGKGRMARIEKLLTEVFDNGVLRNRESVRRYRKELKRMVRPNKNSFKMFADIFMHGRYSITYEQVLSFVTQKNGRS